jgi:hypothetical protein
MLLKVCTSAHIVDGMSSRTSSILTMVVLAITAYTPHALAQRAGYKWETFAKSDVKFEVPLDWKTTSEGDTLVTTAPDGRVSIEFVPVPDMSKEAQIEMAVMRELLKLVPDAKNIGPARSATQGGLSGVTVTGAGTRKGRAVEYLAFIMGDGKGHGVLGLAMAGRGEFAVHKNNVVAILHSLKTAH